MNKPLIAVMLTLKILNCKLPVAVYVAARDSFVSVSELKVVELKSELKRAGLPTSGNKYQLCTRLNEVSYSAFLAFSFRLLIMLNFSHFNQ